MLLAADLQADLKFLVDDENSDRYDFDNDYKPAINAAVRYIMSAFDKAFDRGSLSPFIFSELLYGKIYTPTAISEEDASKVVITTLISGGTVWRIVGIDPAPVVDGTDYIMPGCRLAKWLSFDEWGGPTEDPFEAGYTGQADDVAQYSYTNFNTITPETAVQHLIIRPKPDGDIAIIHLRIPSLIVDEETANFTELPYVLHQPVLMKAYQYMMIQAGKEAVTALQVSDKDVQELIGLFK